MCDHCVSENHEHGHDPCDTHTIVDINECSVMPVETNTNMWTLLQNPVMNGNNAKMNLYLQIKTGIFKFNASEIFSRASENSAVGIFLKIPYMFSLKPDDNCFYKVENISLCTNDPKTPFISCSSIRSKDYTNLMESIKGEVIVATDHCGRILPYSDCIQHCGDWFIKWWVPPSAIKINPNSDANNCNVVEFLLHEIRIEITKVFGYGLFDPVAFNVKFGFFDVGSGVGPGVRPGVRPGDSMESHHHT